MFELSERFWSKVVKGEPDSCWTWTGQFDSGGYGLFWWGKTNDGRKYVKRAHRVSWMAANNVEEIPTGMVVMHLCDNRACVNPKHLQLGSHKENAEDRNSKGRSQVAKGEYAKTSKLTDLDVLSIRRDYRPSRGNMLELAKKYDVGLTTISDIIQNKRWKHLPLSPTYSFAETHEKRYTDDELRSLIVERTLVEASGCHVWLGSQREGRPTFLIHGTERHVIRIAWKLKYGELADNVNVYRTCQTLLCVNPEHLTTYDESRIGTKPRYRNFKLAGSRNKRSKLTESQVQKMREMYKSGRYTHDEIAKKYGISLPSANQAIRGVTWQHVPGAIESWGSAKGEKHGMSKLTSNQVTDIRGMYAAGGITQKELGTRFGVSEQTVYEIVNEKTWASREDPEEKPEPITEPPAPDEEPVPDPEVERRDWHDQLDSNVY